MLSIENKQTNLCQIIGMILIYGMTFSQFEKLDTKEQNIELKNQKNFLIAFLNLLVPNDESLPTSSDDLAPQHRSQKNYDANGLPLISVSHQRW